MNCTVSRLNQLIEIGEAYLSKTHRQQLAAKPKPTQWSKKEILGHLIDSARYNLRRFTEIHIKPKPYQIIDYGQDELVIVNDYQRAEPKDLVMLWVGLNRQIIHVIRELNEKTVQVQAKLPNQKTTSLLFLINDYLEHLEHHVKQIVEP
ncbi:MAG: DinB family protein [Flavobacteriaceae bacterium]